MLYKLGLNNEIRNYKTITIDMLSLFYILFGLMSLSLGSENVNNIKICVAQSSEDTPIQLFLIYKINEVPKELLDIIPMICVNLQQFTPELTTSLILSSNNFNKFDNFDKFHPSLDNKHQILTVYEAKKLSCIIIEISTIGILITLLITIINPFTWI